MKVVATSRLLGSLASLLSRVETAFGQSRVRRALVSAWTPSVADDPVRVTAFAGVVVAVAMLVHLALALFVRRYQFPSRADLIVPAAVLVIALAAIAMRHALGVGWRHRRMR